MTAPRLRPAAWNSLQHYKDRRPPWVKLHRSLLEDRRYFGLPVAARAALPLLWLVASEAADGSLDARPEEVAFRLRVGVDEAAVLLRALTEAGFLEPVVGADASAPIAGSEHGASTALADGLQDACPETEGEAEKRQRTEKRQKPPRAARRRAMSDDFARFWTAYPKKVARAVAERSFRRVAKDEATLEAMLNALAVQSASEDWTREGGRYIPYPATWLNGLRWLDEAPRSASPQAPRPTMAGTDYSQGVPA